MQSASGNSTPPVSPMRKPKTRFLERSDDLPKKIVTVVDLYYDGRRADALRMFREQMDCPDELWNSIGIHTVKEKSGGALRPIGSGRGFSTINGSIRFAICSTFR